MAAVIYAGVETSGASHHSAATLHRFQTLGTGDDTVRVTVIQTPCAPGRLTCAGHLMVEVPPVPCSAPFADNEASDVGVSVGDWLTDTESGLTVVCTRAGTGPLEYARQGSCAGADEEVASCIADARSWFTKARWKSFDLVGTECGSSRCCAAFGATTMACRRCACGAAFAFSRCLWWQPCHYHWSGTSDGWLRRPRR